MSKPRILVQLDSDSHASVFDAVVAADSGANHILQYHDVTPTQIESLVHGAMFTRGPGDLHNTALFVGGSDVAASEALLKKVTSCFFGPMRVSVMFDASGANTTAAAAVVAAARHVSLSDSIVVVLAGTGPVGQRVARLSARQNASVRVCSRSEERARQACDHIQESVPEGRLAALQTANDSELAAALAGAQVVVAAGAAGTQLLSMPLRQQSDSLKVAIDLNAVPPLGIQGTEVTDKAVERNNVTCYGAVGVGETKMKIHKRAVRRLFERNDQVLDAEQIFEIGRALEQERSNESS